MPRRRQNARPTLIAASIAALVAAIAPVAPAFAADPVEVVFDPIDAEQSWTVPAGVTSIHVVLIGAKGSGGGGFAGGLGHNVSGDITVTPGSTIYVEVGGKGIGATPGFNGGGAPGNDFSGTPGAGGGASDIRTISRATPGTIGSRLMVAGGGGGVGRDSAGGNAGAQGGGGSRAGQPGSNNAGGAGGAGDSQGSAGVLGVGGAGGTLCGFDICAVGKAGAGGGGGYYGGGGGAGIIDDSGLAQSGGGGGGSAFTGTATGASVSVETELDASVTITYIVGDPPDPTPGSDSGTVDATISMSESSVCIELSTAAVDFGTGQFGQVGVPGTPEILVTNCGAGEETLFARATDATAPGASWDLVKNSEECGDTLGLDEYHLWLHENQTSDVDWGLGNTNTVLETVQAGSFGSFGPSIDTACPGSTGAGLQMSMQIVFTATEAVP